MLAVLFPLVFGCRALAAWLDDRALIIIDDAGVRWRYWYSRRYRSEPWSVIRAARLERSVRRYGSSEYIRLKLAEGVPTDRRTIISTEYLDLAPEELLALFGRFTFAVDDRWPDNRLADR